VAHWLDNDDWERILKERLLPGHKVRAGHLNATDTFNNVAIENLKAGQVIQLLPTGLKRASSLLGGAIGVVINDALQGQQCEYASRGFVFVSSWQHVTGQVHLTVGSLYFLSGVGGLSTTPASSGYILPVGRAHGPNTLDVSIGTSIKL
jgi:hypothetical protein